MSLDAKEIARKIIQINGEDEAFYVCDLGEVLRRHSEWVKHFPRVTPFYAVKCNDAQVILETLKYLGCGFDCASKSEIEKIISIQVSPSRIIFAHTAKIISHIKIAAKLGVEMVTVDNETELLKLKKYMPGAKILLRLLSEAQKAGYPFGGKFGAPLKECMNLLRISKLLSLTVIGICFHVGSECMEPAAYSRAISRAKTLFDYAKNELDLTLNLVDIGGGLHGHDSHGYSTSDFSQVINSALDKYFPDVSVQIVAEPGRFFPTTACTLFTQIHSKKEINDVEGSPSNMMYYINDGIYGSFSLTNFDKNRSPVQVLREMGKGKMFKSTVFGPTCDAKDKISEDVFLPRLNVGDWLYFRNMGSYALTAGGGFNGFPLPKLYVVMGQEAWQLVKDVFEDEKMKIISKDETIECHPMINIWGSENGIPGLKRQKRIKGD